MHAPTAYIPASPYPLASASIVIATTFVSLDREWVLCVWLAYIDIAVTAAANVVISFFMVISSLLILVNLRYVCKVCLILLH